MWMAAKHLRRQTRIEHIQYIPQYCVKYQNRPRECVDWRYWQICQFSCVSVDGFLNHQGCVMAHHILHKKVSVIEHHWQKRSRTWCFENSLWAPLGYNSGEPNLFRVVGNIWPKTKNRIAKVTIRTLHDYWLCHVWFEWREDQLETAMVKLATEDLEVGPFSLASARLKWTPQH